MTNYRSSLENLDTADSLLPGVPGVTFYRGRNHEELGNLQTAANAYRQYLRVAPRGKHADYCRERLRAWY
ncbi:MAG: tetratricopeptide repeat protein [bacterium]